jgi:hypothetical protein
MGDRERDRDREGGVGRDGDGDGDGGEYAPVQLSCSPTVARKDCTKPCCSYLDISFLDPAALLARPLHALVFENSYVSSISCAQQVSDGTEFVILDRQLLMPSVSSCVGAQQVHTVLASAFNSRYRGGLPIRVYLFQPSPHWTAFDLKDVRGFALSGDGDGGGQGKAPPPAPAPPPQPLAADLALLRGAVALRQKNAQSVVQGSKPGAAKGKLRKSKR